MNNVKTNQTINKGQCGAVLESSRQVQMRLCAKCLATMMKDITRELRFDKHVKYIYEV